MSVGDLLEGVVLHSFENIPPFSPHTLRKIQQLKEVYGCDLVATDSHQLTEEAE